MNFSKMETEKQKFDETPKFTRSPKKIKKIEKIEELGNSESEIDSIRNGDRGALPLERTIENTPNLESRNTEININNLKIIMNNN